MGASDGGRVIEPLLAAERLILVGLLDQAEAIYERVAHQDPRNSIAVMGLARVAMARGEEEAALGHARRALKIDPENAAAQALSTRLSELLGARSDPEEARRENVGLLRRVLRR